MFMIPLTRRDFFFEDPYFQTHWQDYGRLHAFMFQQPRSVWRRVDDKFLQLACMANNIMADWDQRRQRQPTTRTVPVQCGGPPEAVQGQASEAAKTESEKGAEKSSVTEATPSTAAAAKSMPVPETLAKTAPAGEKAMEKGAPLGERKSSREQESASREQESASREQESASREQESASRQQESASRQQESASRQQESARREQESARREQESASREQESASREPESASREQESASREQKESASQDLLARWERSWMFPRRWMLPSFKTGYEQLFRDLDLFRERDGDVVRVKDEADDALEITFDMSQYRPDELRVSVAGGLLSVEGRHEEGEEGGKQVVRQFLRRFSMPKGSRPEDVASNLSSDGVLVVTVKKPAVHEVQINKQQQEQLKQQQGQQQQEQQQQQGQKQQPQQQQQQHQQQPQQQQQKQT
jgi:HSP20 family molecular chaperone IbpA